MLILEPAANRKPGIFVVGVSQRSGDEFFKHRSAEIIGLLRSGITVCLPDLPGAGKLKFGNSLERTATHTSYSATTQMFGVPLAKIRLDALDAVVGFIGEKHERPKIGLWGESFASVNDPVLNLEVPYDAGPSPNIAEPMGGNLPIYAAFHLWKADVRCVLGRGGLVGYESALRSPFLYVPHDALVPPFWRNVELDDVVRMTHATGKTKVRFEKMVDGLNRIVPQTEMEKQYPHSRQAMKEDLILRAEPSSAEETVDWFVKCLR